jgi:protoporphyrinogen oxidase
VILILGGGLAGMSTAHHLGRHRHCVLEAESEPGGLCRSRRVDGFLFDYTGHLLHLRDPLAIALVDELLPGALVKTERRASIRTRGVTLPFPFQAHLHGLPPEVVANCILGLVEALGGEVPTDPATSFEAWSLAVFGRGISDAFMLPYNAKLFRRAPAEMTADWVSWAVPRPTLEQVVRGALGIVNPGMGYNSSFGYPARGGIGALPAALAARLPHLRLGCTVERVDVARRTVRLAGGEVLRYERLVNTLPLPRLLSMIDGGRPDLARLAARLDWSVVGCLNLGVDRSDLADGAHWIYFPDDDAPFYRVGFPTNFSDSVAPAGAGSMYVEFGLRRGERLDAARLERDALAALRREGILRERDRVLARDLVRIDPGYVIFDRARQEVLAEILPWLESLDVSTIGRYGAWTYSYMERALLDGMETAARLVGCATGARP